jgi:hypothetical protein
MPALKITLTSAGRAALRNAEADGTAPVRLASIGVTATSFVPDAGMVALPGEVKRVATLKGGATAADTLHVTMRDASTDTYTVRGIGLYLDDAAKTLFAVYSQADVLLEKSAQATALLALDVVFADLAAASITVGDTNFQLNGATVATAGVVQLADDLTATAGADGSRAVTPKSLLAALNARLGAGNPSSFVKSLLDKASALAFVTALGIRGAASYDIGTGNGLDADLLDGQHGAYYLDWNNLANRPAAFPPTAHTHTWDNISGAPETATRWPAWGEVTGKPGTFTPSPHSHAQADIIGLVADLAAKAPITSPVLTGIPTAPTAASTTNTNQLATTAFVQQVIANVINGAPGALDTLKELADAMGDDPNFAATVTNALAGKLSTGGGNVGGSLTLTAGNLTVNAGSVIAAGNLVSGQNVLSSTPALVLGTAGPGAIYLRPNGPGSTSGQVYLDSLGNVTTPGNVTATQVFAAGGMSMQGNSSGLGGNDYIINFYPNRWLSYNKAQDTYIFANTGLFVAGSVTASGGFQVSDRRFKHNIQLRALDASLPEKLAPLWSQWNRNSDGRFDTGLIAQDVLAVAPQFVQIPADPEQMLAIDKSGLALECALAAEIRIQQLLARLEALENPA